MNPCNFSVCKGRAKNAHRVALCCPMLTLWRKRMQLSELKAEKDEGDEKIHRAQGRGTQGARLGHTGCKAGIRRG